jgi:hypothetical protein
MKLFLQSIFLIMAINMHGVMGTLAVRIIFNRGSTESSKFCPETDWDMVEIAADKGAARRRRLGQTTHARQLQTYCQTVCANMRPGTCYLSGTGCRNRRRALAESATMDPADPVEQVNTSSSPPSRQLFTVAACEAKKVRVLAELAAITPKVGPSCRALILNVTPELTCFDV